MKTRQIEQNNTYIFTVEVSDGDNNATKTFMLKVININDNAPKITSSTTDTIQENDTNYEFEINATDADNDTLTYSISKDDNNSFNINSSTGVITFKTAPDYENPTDSNNDNNYTIIIKVSDGTYFDEQNITIEVLDVSGPPQITTEDNGTVQENNSSYVFDVDYVEDDGDEVNFSISGGADSRGFDMR